MRSQTYLMDETRSFLINITEKWLKQTWAENIISPIFFFKRKKRWCEIILKLASDLTSYLSLLEIVT